MVVHLAAGNAHLFQLAGDGFLGFFHGQTRELLGVHQLAALAQIILLFKGALADIAAVDDLDHGNMMCNGVLKVALVVAGNGHDGAGAIVAQHEVTNEHGHFLAVDGVDGINALERAAGLGLGGIGAVDLALAGSFPDVSLDLFLVLNAVHQPLHDLAVGRQHHEGDAVDGFDTGGVDGELAAAHQLEIHLNAGGLADPVALDLLGGFGPVDLVQAFQQLFSKGGLIDDPLHHHSLFNGIAAALALSVDDLIVGKHRTQRLAPVHGHLDALGITGFPQLLEDPLGPLVELGIGCGDHLGPVVVKAQLLQLLGEGFDVLLGKAVGMVAGIHGVLLGRQTKAVIAHGMQHVVALHALHAAHDIGGGIALGMACVQAYAGGIGEHIQDIVLGLGEIPHIGGEGVVLLPVLLPFLFNTGVAVNGVFHIYFSSPGVEPLDPVPRALRAGRVFGV